MLVRGVGFAMEEDIAEVKNIYKFNNNFEYLLNFIEYDDNALVRDIVSKSDGWAKKCFESIINRKLLKEIFNVEISDMNFDDKILLMYALNPSDGQMEEICSRVAEILKVPKELVMLDRKSTSNPIQRLPG